MAGKNDAGGGRIDAGLVQAAIRKRAAGQPLTVRETSALAKLEKDREERDRWRFYRAVPQKHLREMSGRQTKQINEQAERYGLPIGGPEVDLTKFFPALFRFLADNAAKLAADTPLADTALEKQRAVTTRLKELDLQEREGQLIARGEVHDFLMRLAIVLRSAGELLARHHGQDAQQILNEALADFTAEVEKFFTDQHAE